MVVLSFTAASTASAILSLSKRAWKLGIALSKLEQATSVVDTSIKTFAEEVKSLGIECDLVCAELETVTSRSWTRPSPLYDIDDQIWNCLDMQIVETSETIQELEMFVGRVRGEQSDTLSQAQRPRVPDDSRDRVASIRTRVSRHADNLHTITLLINTVLTHLAPGQVDQRLSGELSKLQYMLEKLHRSSNADPHSRSSRTEASLMQRAREVIAQGTTMYETSLPPVSPRGGQEANNVRVAEWVGILKSLRQTGSGTASNDRCEGNDVMTSRTFTQHAHECKDEGAIENNTDDDLETDLAKSALDTGTKAFEAGEWVEADSLLQEALQLLQQLSKQQRKFCRIFSLHYKLAVCAYHTQESADAEVALQSLVQSASSDEERGFIHNVTHLLSQLHVRTGKYERARSECEQALQTRRRLLGKNHDASLESTALMAHIYVLLNNRPRAKSCLAMIPEARREAAVKSIEDSLGTVVEHLDYSSLRTRTTSEDPDIAAKRIQDRLSGTTLGLAIEDHSYRPLSAMVKTPAPSIQQPPQYSPPHQTSFEISPSVTVANLSPQAAVADLRATEEYSAGTVALDTASLNLGEPSEMNGNLRQMHFSRKEILDKIGCQPRDRIEDAVCDGDHSALTSLLDKKKDFWRSKLRKRIRPERVTALHFAALFGEIDMARSLLVSSFNVNDVPYGYTTSLSHLKMAIGARQVAMVEFLVANGAKPSEPDTWSTLAGQLMSRSWLVKTMSEAEKEFVPNRIVAIMSILLRSGWDLSVPFESSGATVLHQAVAFWTGSYRWDLNLRAVITSFLCERGANPYQQDNEGKAPYDLALASGHQDLLMILNQGSKRRELEERSTAPIELSS
ncbi:hypothetical protein K458DRAFT_479804 [Lentithecium fluviatile CBS 122367]|uniref:Uncharacterized protein n=1 Tax=Lentithecium fluviatile CBS 122367 TaxID=1168545 RepID=A0A6G1IS71_9PLEO|nr:hypothetical protein K458DRAFT_479804 [Lentithecium fluviatile CBS 122367]